MSAFDPAHVKVGPGTLYAADLSTTEPASVTGAWPAGWVKLGYTDAGSIFNLTPTVEDVEVAEEFWPVDSQVTKYEGTLDFALAENTRQNLAIVLNAGVTSLAASTTGAESDGTLWVEPPDLGTEKRIMLGWDALAKGASTGDVMGRLVARKCLQTGQLSIAAQKAPNKRNLNASFRLFKPTGAQPFRMWVPAMMAS